MSMCFGADKGSPPCHCPAFFFLTFIVASLGSFGKPLTEFESIERKIWLIIEKEYVTTRSNTTLQLNFYLSILR